MEKNNVVIVSAVRTPFGRFGGALKDFPSIDLAAMVVRDVLQRANVEGGGGEEIYYGWRDRYCLGGRCRQHESGPLCHPSGCSMGEKTGKYSNMGWSIRIGLQGI